VTELSHIQYSLPRSAIHAFFAALRANTEPGPVPALPDNAIYCDLEGSQFRLTFYATGMARHFTLVGEFVGDERLHLTWKIETALHGSWMTIGGGIVALLVFLMGLTSKDGPQWFTLFWAFPLGAVSYFNYRTLNLAKDDSEKLLLETVQNCIDEAERVTQSAPLLSAPVPNEPTP